MLFYLISAWRAIIAAARVACEEDQWEGHCARMFIRIGTLVEIRCFWGA